MTWPTEAECERFYGKKGENQTSVVPPFPMFLAWEPYSQVRRITCHEKIADSFSRILRNMREVYGEAELHKLGLDRFGGCLNVRLKRGSRSSWSIHSWGCAVDLDPDRNKLRENHTTARFARPEYLEFWRIVEAEGWVSLGRARDFDWMHFQAARL